MIFIKSSYVKTNSYTACHQKSPDCHQKQHRVTRSGRCHQKLSPGVTRCHQNSPEICRVTRCHQKLSPCVTKYCFFQFAQTCPSISQTSVSRVLLKVDSFIVHQKFGNKITQKRLQSQIYNFLKSCWKSWKTTSICTLPGYRKICSNMVYLHI